MQSRNFLIELLEDWRVMGLVALGIVISAVALYCGVAPADEFASLEHAQAATTSSEPVAIR